MLKAYATLSSIQHLPLTLHHAPPNLIISPVWLQNVTFYKDIQHKQEATTAKFS
jgi:hypothetical protein